jgi:hypothetical protein
MNEQIPLQMQFSYVRNEGLHHDKGSMLFLFRKEGEITFSRDGLDCADHRSRAILCSGLSSYVKTNLAEAGFCFSDIDGSAEPSQTYRVSYLVGFILSFGDIFVSWDDWPAQCRAPGCAVGRKWRKSELGRKVNRRDRRRLSTVGTVRPFGHPRMLPKP